MGLHVRPHSILPNRNVLSVPAGERTMHPDQGHLDDERRTIIAMPMMIRIAAQM
jgi:hypothetical protein